MDVLREIKEAEAKAEAIEREFRSKADELISSIPFGLQKEKDRLDDELRRQLSAAEAENTKLKEKEKAEIAAETAGESTHINKQAAANMAKAVETIVASLGS
jgi:hypothetical protein